MSAPVAITFIQLGVFLVGLMALAFFALFTGYYFRNRRMALELRRTGREAQRAAALTSVAAGDDEQVSPRTDGARGRRAGRT